MSSTTSPRSLQESAYRPACPHRGDEREGFSIPAQREANRKKAQSMGAMVAKEFVDRREPAKTANRPAVQEMLEYIREHSVDYVVVHKVDRLARNREDDVEIMKQLTAANVALISATESIDQSPSGALLHGIMSSIAEFYSRNLAHEVTKGMTQKVQKRGTPGRAPLGYLNVREFDSDGRESRTVRPDADRAPLISRAFTATPSREPFSVFCRFYVGAMTGRGGLLRGGWLLALNSSGGASPGAVWRLLLVNQSTQPVVTRSTSSIVRGGLFRNGLSSRIASVVNSPIVDSGRPLS
ncbi:recombinase family protein [Rathayibacter sp. VKM Ac-2878]|nr:recombinase family protein [Rathayibacter sp. VKM Ac-2879]MBF4503168.1 recombinase family protein [Rathayibacter sp. VKM Ac-2878]